MRRVPPWWIGLMEKWQETSKMISWETIWPQWRTRNGLARKARINANYTGWWLTYPSEKNESQLRLLFPIYGGKNVPNHQAV